MLLFSSGTGYKELYDGNLVLVVEVDHAQLGCHESCNQS